MEHVVVSSDHAGFELKTQLKPFLVNLGYAVDDVGTFSTEPVDYPEYTLKAVEKVASGEYRRGIVFCGTGQGDAIAANKVPGIRAALCWDEPTARLSRAHNDANVLVLGGWVVGLEPAQQILRVWLATPFDGGRHQRRIRQIKAIETQMRLRRGKVYDISLAIHEGMLSWPGDPPVVVKTSESECGGRLTQLNFSAHTGSHVDAPSHFIRGGADIDKIALDALLGPARVLQLPEVDCIDRQLLSRLNLAGVSRLLIGTGNSALLKSRVFCPQYAYLTEAAAGYLVETGIKLIALDYLSVDKYDDPNYPAHRILLEKGVVIVEGVDLSAVPAGDYELLCLPLKIGDSDGAPARVVLREV